MNPQQIADLIRQSIPDAQVDVQSQDNTHFAALLIGAAFEGLRPLARHQLVYRALGDSAGHDREIELFQQLMSSKTEKGPAEAAQ